MLKPLLQQEIYACEALMVAHLISLSAAQVMMAHLHLLPAVNTSIPVGWLFPVGWLCPAPQSTCIQLPKRR